MQISDTIRRAGWLASLSRRARPTIQAACARLRSSKARLALQVAIILLCLIPIGRQAAQDWGEVGVLVRQLQSSALIAATLALVIGSLFLPTAMAAFTRGAAGRIRYRDSALAYYASQPMKYLPGNFWILPGRVMLLRGLGYDASLSSAALIFEMTTQALSSALMAVVMLGLSGFTSLWRGAAWLILAGTLAVSALLVVAPPLVLRLLRRPSPIREAIAQLATVPLAARIRNLVLATALFVAMWLLMGASFYGLVVATDPHLDLALLKASIGVFSLSWLVGFLTPFSPGGIGVREGAIVLLLSPIATGPVAIMVALLSRVLSLAVELLFFAAVCLPLRSARKRAPRT